MQRIPTVEMGAAPQGSKPILEQIKAKFRRVPNIFASVAHSPAAYPDSGWFSTRRNTRSIQTSIALC